MANFNDRNIVSDTNGSVLDLMSMAKGPEQAQNVTAVIAPPSVAQQITVPFSGEVPFPHPKGDIDDYDFTAAKDAGVKPDARGHWPDTYKKPNHITFSDESLFNDGGAGHWENIDDHWYFTPGPTNLKHYSMEELRKYFRQFEPDATLVEPQQSGEVVPMKRKPLDLTDPKQLDEYKKMMTRDTLSRALGGTAPVLPMTPKNE